MTALKLATISCILLIFSLECFSQPFFDPGIGAPALGLGSAFTAMANDATAAYWNPARLSLLAPRVYATAGWQPFEGGGRVFPFAASAIQWQGGALGSWWAHQRDADETRSGMGLAAGYDFGLFQLGTTLKWLHVRDAVVDATGVGLDLAMMVNFFDTVFVGAVVQDALQTRLKDGKTVHREQDPSVRAGAAVQLGSFTFTSEAVLMKNSLEAVRFGVEIGLMGVVAFRVGKDDALWGWGVGVGLLDRMRLDVAQRLGGQNGNVWLFSFHLSLPPAEWNPLAWAAAL